MKTYTVHTTCTYCRGERTVIREAATDLRVSAVCHNDCSVSQVEAEIREQQELDAARDA